MLKYRMYVDEVGNPDLESASNPNHRFLGLTGVIISLVEVKEKLHPAFEDLKSRYFNQHPDEPIIFHRKEMIHAKNPFEALGDPKMRKAFDAELLKLISETEFKALTVVIDKQEHAKQYTTWRYAPYHYCMEILLERYVLFLKRMQLIGDVMAESRGGKEDKKLKESFCRICEQGTNYIKSDIIQSCLTSRQLKVKSKMNNISGLQLADLVAHPSRREILIEHRKIEDTRKELFADEIIKILARKYDKVGRKIYGKKFLP